MPCDPWYTTLERSAKLVVGGKITRYPKRRERRPAKMFKRGDGPEVVGRVTLMG